MNTFAVICVSLIIQIITKMTQSVLIDENNFLKEILQLSSKYYLSLESSRTWNSSQNSNERHCELFTDLSLLFNLIIWWRNHDFLKNFFKFFSVFNKLTIFFDNAARFDFCNFKTRDLGLFCYNLVVFTFQRLNRLRINIKSFLPRKVKKIFVLIWKWQNLEVYKYLIELKINQALMYVKKSYT